MSRKGRGRRRPDGVDAGSSWISYSDMMAAMMLVFVLILCYSLYQYFQMLEIKTIELETQQATLETQETRLDDQTAQLAQQQTDLDAKEDELQISHANLLEKEALLDQQTITLNDQRAQLSAARIGLDTKEDELANLQSQLADKETKLDAATSLLDIQRQTMDAQQKTMDAQYLMVEQLVGMRTKIIKDLSITLQNANLRASVDKNTGNIVLDSAVFFDTGSNSLKESGKQLLNQFLPVYLSVLLQPAYQEFLGEIIIEGHTDPQGEYLMNLELSQQRALTVAKYCLQMDGLTPQQQEYLRTMLTTKGKHYSNPVYDASGNIDMDASRRVEFKFSLKDAEMIEQMNALLSPQ